MAFYRKCSVKKVETRPRRVLTPPQGMFWDRVGGFVVRGDTSSARGLVSDRLRDSKDWTRSVASVGLNDGVIGGLAVLEHLLVMPSKDDWKEWQFRCGTWASCDEIFENKKISGIMKILSGDIDAIMQAGDNWDDCFVGCVIYCRDVNQAVNELEARPTMPSYGKILLKFMTNDYNDGIYDLHNFYGSFYAARLSDLLLRLELLHKKQRDFYVLEYGHLSEQICGLWRITMDYYSTCLNGRLRITNLIEEVQVKGATDRVADKFCFICRAKNIDETKLCTRIGEQCLQIENYGGAIAWFTRGGFDDRCCTICYNVLCQAEVGGIRCIEANRLASVITAPSDFGSSGLKQRLLFISNYHLIEEALARIDQGDVEINFIDIVRNVIRGYPKRFCLVVIYDVFMVIDKLEMGNMCNKVMIMYLLTSLELCERQGLKSRLKVENADHVIDDIRKTLIAHLV